MAETTERSLEDLYRENPKKLQGSIEPSTLNLAARVILQLEAGSRGVGLFTTRAIACDSLLLANASILSMTQEEQDQEGWDNCLTNKFNELSNDAKAKYCALKFNEKPISLDGLGSGNAGGNDQSNESKPKKKKVDRIKKKLRTWVGGQEPLRDRSKAYGQKRVDRSIGGGTKAI
ncbi:hypothetical protein HD806DRAFT_476737 [Xylariaceae sp. AK1471]|nr:hypothetical protein HD806DRAFT_476737 [Xylariaceae sp. AK1471]